MKKLTILLITMLLLAGCMAMNTQENNIVDAIPNQATEQFDGEQEVASDTGPHTAPPKQLRFHGFDEIAKLSELLDKSDSEVEECLLSYDSSRLYMNGLENKNAVKDLLATLSEMYFPIVDGMQEPYIIIYPDWNQVRLIYNEFADEGSYNFRISTEPNSARKKLQSIQEEGTILYDMGSGSSMQTDALSGVTSKIPDGIEIYPRINDKNSATYDKDDPAQTIYMDIKGEYMMARVFNVNELSTCVNGLLAFNYAKLSFTENGAQVVEVVGKSTPSDAAISEENELDSASE